MELKELFEMAIQSEIEGRELYLAASKTTKDKKAKKIFLSLSKEEDSHIQALQDIAKSTLKGGAVTIPKLAPVTTFDDAKSPIFTQEFKDAIKDKHYEVSTLRIGLKLEAEAAKFYRGFAKKVTQPEVKKFLLFLAKWESDHYDKLKQQLGFLENAYMTQNSMFRF
mgnify:CR=1 FL=1